MLLVEHSGSYFETVLVERRSRPVMFGAKHECWCADDIHGKNVRFSELFDFQNFG